MNFEEFKNLFKSLKKHPILTGLFIILVILLFIVGAYLTGYLGEKGRQQAATKSENAAIKQSTEGNQSPAVVSEGDVNIDIGNNKK